MHIKHSMYWKLKNAFITLILSGLFGATNLFAQGYSLDANAVVQINSVTCGFVITQWVPGKRIKSGNFLPTTDSIVTLKKKLKNKGLSTDKKNGIKKKIKKLKKSLQKSNAICATLGGGTASPSPTPAVPVAPASPLPGATTIAWSLSALDLGGGVGTEALVFCPSNPFESLRAIYGHDVYTADSPICVAAVHAGLFNRNAGGNVRVRIAPGSAYYIGSVRSGIQSNFYGSYNLSFVFLDINSGAELITASIPQITFFQTAQPLYTYVDQQFTFLCPSGLGEARSIWGTDLYTYDSSICTAAVHAGRISLAGGGVITIQIRPGAASYTGSVRNGISSNSYGPWDGSYIFVP